MQREAKNARESAQIGALPSLAGVEEQGGNDMYSNGSCEKHAVPTGSQAVLFLVGSKSSKAVKPFFS